MPNLFERPDWMAFAITAVTAFLVYWFNLAPQVTLSYSGELATGAYQLGVPHNPGFPLWVIYAWSFCKLIPFGSVAYRIGLSSAFAGALAAGLIALLVSRGSRPLFDQTTAFKNLPATAAIRIRLACGVAAGLLFGFSQGMWSQAVIVEVHSLTALFLMLTVAALFRWMHAPQQKRYLWLMGLLYGASLHHHQTLLLSAVGLIVVVVVIRPGLGRDILFVCTLAFLAVWRLKSQGYLPMFQSYADDVSLFFTLACIAGVACFLGCVFLVIKTRRLLTEFKGVLACLSGLALGAATYFLVPIFSMTNPPINWGYPRTTEGLWHAFSRGQYSRTNPTDVLHDPMRFLRQLGEYLGDISGEFLWVGVILALIPLVALAMHIWRRRGTKLFDAPFILVPAWMLGLFCQFLGLGVLMLILLNIPPGSHSREFSQPYFIPSKALLALFVGYGMAMAIGLLADRFGRLGNSVWPYLGCMLMPGVALALNWTACSQRGHWFGYWFGHDLFKPPFTDRQAQSLYPEMKRNAIFFGGTDSGRFVGMYMIYCESHTPARRKPMDPGFDRRDVYILTQNALADGTYLNEIRAHYNRSRQIDPPFFQELLRSDAEKWKNSGTNFLARMVTPLDRFFMKYGSQTEQRRRAAGVYPKAEIHTPNSEDSQTAFAKYLEDVQRRMQNNKLRTGEDVQGIGGRFQISGQQAVMAINGLIAKLIFDKNPESAFYIEESSPLDWMYPHLTPFGIIMEIQRVPLRDLTGELLDRDHLFWQKYTERLIGDWITDQTSVAEICAFVERVYIHRSLAGFHGNPHFAHDSDAQKAFSKLRSSIAGIYAWRLSPQASSVYQPKSPAQRQRLLREAEFAFKQALALCPFNPEAVFGYINLILITQPQRIDDALLIARTCKKWDPGNPQIEDLIHKLEEVKVRNETAPAQIALLEAQHLVQPTVSNALKLAPNHLSLQRSNDAVRVLTATLQQPQLDTNALTSLAIALAQLNQAYFLEQTLTAWRQLLTFESKKQILINFRGRHAACR